jgi:hypothetical protein
VTAFGLYHLRDQPVSRALQGILEKAPEFRVILDALKLLVIQSQSLLDYFGELIFIHVNLLYDFLSSRHGRYENEVLKHHTWAGKARELTDLMSKIISQPWTVNRCSLQGWCRPLKNMRQVNDGCSDIMTSIPLELGG